MYLAPKTIKKTVAMLPQRFNDFPQRWDVFTILQRLLHNCFFNETSKWFTIISIQFTELVIYRNVRHPNLKPGLSMRSGWSTPTTATDLWTWHDDDNLDYFRTKWSLVHSFRWITSPLKSIWLMFIFRIIFFWSLDLCGSKCIVSKFAILFF